jgi:protein-tyrosine-phosphatase
MGILNQALHAFKRNDAELAKQTMKLTHQTIPQFNDVLDALVEEQNEHQITDLFALFVVFHHLVRVSDQSKNICEDVVFAVTGETKAKKVYKILFVDEDDGCLGQMAKAIGNKSHSKGGEFESAGRSPASVLHSGLADFMDQRGVDFEAGKPKSIQDLSSELDDYHVIVSLKGKARSYLESVPFHTTLLDWDVGEAPPEGADACDIELDNAYRQLAVQINDLMCLLRGEGPSRG